MPIKKSLIFILFCLSLVSCSLTKYVPQGETLLNRTKIKKDIPDISASELNSYILQKPNSFALSFMRTRLATYSLSGSDTTKWINRTLRKIGEEPVIFDENSTERTQNLLNQAIVNKGYLNAEVSTNISTKKKKTNVTYQIVGGEPYKIENFEVVVDYDTINKFLQRFYQNGALKGELFDVDLLNAERARATQALRRSGYYNVQKEMFAYTADTTETQYKVDVKMVLQPQYAVDSVAKVIFRKKKIDRVTIYCYTDTKIQDENYLSDLDTVFYKNYRIIYNQKKHIFTPKILATKTVLAEGQTYNEFLVSRTNSNLASLSAIKYVNISFTEKDDDLLDCNIYVSPSDRFGYSVEVEGTTAMGADIGAGVKVGYSDKNVFKGAEIFKLGANVAYEAIFMRSADEKTTIDNAYIVGGEASLTIPQILIPFLKENARKRYGGTTIFSLNYSYQDRPEQFKRHIANGFMKYNWQTRNSNFSFSLIDLSYVNVPWMSEDFTNRIENKYTKYSFENHFTTKMSFGFSTSNQRANLKHQSFYTLRTNFSVAGNLFYGLSALTKQEKDSVGRYQIFNTPYSQFIKGEIDFSYNQFITEKLRFVFHTALGIGLPYGNSNIMPFEERFIPNNRGWHPRTLGPGTYSSDSTEYLERSGDIKIEFNAEFRFKLFWVLEGAAFVDLGNIWTIKPYGSQTGGVFSFKNGQFLEQFGCSYGIGLRADFSFFILRFDLGIKLFDPKYEGAKRWRGPKYSDGWREDCYLSFGIGYPF
ncbi:MAG: BamA/TamA family outer membrane protein [Prevotellaceae bacterium]|jgi:hypothetical protein|nr:BamA/TamA family outer membrane protein [Prevotellaceae bacterium]